MFFTYTKFIMNQILNTNLEKNTKNLKKKDWFRFQFSVSLSIISILIICGIFYWYHLSKEENFSDNLIASYEIYRLYNNPENTTNTEETNGLFGIIEIPKINLYYPVFSSFSEELLKTSPCKFFGSTLKSNGNICIAGHNYDNSLFFSKIGTLLPNDEISIFDNNGKKYLYTVYDIYEVKDTDLSPIFNYPKNEKILTLVTCNNFNSNRIIVRAKQRSS